MTQGGWWGEPGAAAREVPVGEEWSGPTVRSSNTPPEQDHFPENEIKRNCIKLFSMQINRNLSWPYLLEVKSICSKLSKFTIAKFMAFNFSI